jgi:hypothetical protein
MTLLYSPTIVHGASDPSRSHQCARHPGLGWTSLWFWRWISKLSVGTSNIQDGGSTLMPSAVHMVKSVLLDSPLVTSGLATVTDTLVSMITMHYFSPFQPSVFRLSTCWVCNEGPGMIVPTPWHCLLLVSSALADFLPGIPVSSFSWDGQSPHTVSMWVTQSCASDPW